MYNKYIINVQSKLIKETKKLQIFKIILDVFVFSFIKTVSIRLNFVLTF